MRRQADRLDSDGATKVTSYTFTYERGIGVVFREDGRGCPVSYQGEHQLDLAGEQAGGIKGKVMIPYAPELTGQPHAIGNRQALVQAYRSRGETGDWSKVKMTIEHGPDAATIIGPLLPAERREEMERDSEALRKYLRENL